MEPLVKADELVALLRISRRKFDQLYLSGEMPKCVRIGRQRFWRPEDIEHWINQQVESTVPATSEKCQNVDHERGPV